MTFKLVNMQRRQFTIFFMHVLMMQKIDEVDSDGSILLATTYFFAYLWMPLLFLFDRHIYP